MSNLTFVDGLIGAQHPVTLEPYVRREMITLPHWVTRSKNTGKGLGIPWQASEEKRYDREDGRNATGEKQGTKSL